MQTYIGVKCVKAEPMTKNGVDGYEVLYPDGYKSWSPKNVFESAYFPIEQEDRLTSNDIDNFLNKSEISSYQGDPKTTVLRVLTPTGFVTWDFASCIDPENYDEAIGCNIALSRVKNKIWELLGFVLQWGAYGLTDIKTKTAK